MKYDSMPTILLPSQWMAIMYRYKGRTQDDYQSFVSFLTLRSNEETLPSKISVDRIHTVLSGISEITEDIYLQATYAEQIIENDVLNILQEQDRDLLYHKSIDYVKENMGEQLQQKEQELSRLSEDMENLQSRNEKLKDEHVTLADNFEQLKETNERLAQTLQGERINRAFKKWQFIGYVAILAIILLVIWTLLHFFHQEKSYNIYSKIYTYIDQLPQSARDVFVGIDILFITSGLACLVKVAWDRVYRNSQKAKIKLSELENENAIETT